MLAASIASFLRSPYSLGLVVWLGCAGLMALVLWLERRRVACCIAVDAILDDVEAAEKTQEYRPESLGVAGKGHRV